MKKSASVGLKVYPDIKERLEKQAKLEKRSKNWLATKYIEEGLAKAEAARKSKGQN